MNLPSRATRAAGTRRPRDPRTAVRTFGTGAVLAGLLCLGAADLRAQEPAADSASTGRLVLYGVGGGAVGLLAGGFLGAAVGGGDLFNRCDFERWVCALHGSIAGAVIGESAGLALGVHLGNSRRGRYLPAMLSSLLIGAAGTALALELEDPEAPFLLVLTPAVQLLATILIERRGR